MHGRPEGSLVHSRLADAELLRRGEALLRASGPWRIEDDRGTEPPAVRLARDHQLLEAVTRGAAPDTARVWENGRCLVTARADARLPRFAAASRQLAEEGWPVLQRESGGSAVPHGPGLLQLSLAFRPPAGVRCTLESGYAALCLPVRSALAELGLDVRLGAAPGSFCDGRFNLLFEGRKIAGTAQRWRAGVASSTPGMGAILAHAILLVEGDREAWTSAVNRFYALAGGERRCHAGASVTVTECLGAETPARRKLLEVLPGLLPLEP
jgi:octanoyl-[GcvH]:protein N-octanoyltransferase